MKPLIIASICLLTAINLSAQTYTLRESESVNDDFLHALFLTKDGKYVDLRYASPHGAFTYNRDYKETFMDVYDTRLKQLYSKPVPQVEDKEGQAFTSVDGKILMAYTDKKKNAYLYQLDVASGNAREVGKIESGKEKSVHIATGFSPDGARIFVVCRYLEKKYADYKGIVMDREFRIINRFAVTEEGSEKDVQKVYYTLSNTGVFAIITAWGGTAKEDDFNPLRHTIIQVQESGSASRSPLTNIPAGLFDKITWHGEGNDLFFTGCLAKNKGENLTAILSGVFNGQQKTTTVTRTSTIPDEGLPLMAGLVTSFKSGETTTLIFQEGFREWNSRFSGWINFQADLTAERLTPSTTIYSSRDVPQINIKNIYVVQLGQSNKITWMKTIRKHQSELYEMRYSGFTSLVDTKGGLSLFFNDARDNRQPEGSKHTHALLPGRKNEGLACVYITKDGTVTKKFLDTYDENNKSDFFFSTPEAIPDGTSRIIYSAYDYKNIGKSKYRLATITEE